MQIGGQPFLNLGLRVFGEGYVIEQLTGMAEN